MYRLVPSYHYQHVKFCSTLCRRQICDVCRVFSRLWSGEGLCPGETQHSLLQIGYHKLRPAILADTDGTVLGIVINNKIM